MNNQPMGFYPLETLKQDAQSFGVPFLNPCVNRSQVRCIPAEGAVLLGLRFVRDIGEEVAQNIVAERESGGLYTGASDFVRRTGVKPQAVQSLVQAGAFDGVTSTSSQTPTSQKTPHRRTALWEAGLAIRPAKHGQRAFPVATADNVPQMADFDDFERMVGEYAVMGIYPKGHLMEHFPTLAGP